MILDTTVLVYALGEGHALREPCRRVIAAIREERLTATTTPEVVQEFVHVRSRRRSRGDAVEHGGAYRELLSPLVAVTEEDLALGLSVYERHEGLGAFDSVLAGVALERHATLVSGDASFSEVPGLRHVHPAAPQLDDVLD